MVALLPVAAFAGIMRSKDRRIQCASLGPLVGAVIVGALFGSRLELRYLGAAFVVALPYFGALLRARASLCCVCILLVWPTWALLSQLAAERAELDPEAHVPNWVVVEWPKVDTRPLFNAFSTEDATRLRKLAFQLAEVAPEGSTIITEPLPDGREGELFWPLRVLRPDLKMAVR